MLKLHGSDLKKLPEDHSLSTFPVGMCLGMRFTDEKFLVERFIKQAEFLEDRKKNLDVVKLNVEIQRKYHKFFKHQTKDKQNIKE